MGRICAGTAIIIDQTSSAVNPLFLATLLTSVGIT